MQICHTSQYPSKAIDASLPEAKLLYRGSLSGAGFHCYLFSHILILLLKTEAKEHWIEVMRRRMQWQDAEGRTNHV